MAVLMSAASGGDLPATVGVSSEVEHATSVTRQHGTDMLAIVLAKPISVMAKQAGTERKVMVGVVPPGPSSIRCGHSSELTGAAAKINLRRDSLMTTETFVCLAEDGGPGDRDSRDVVRGNYEPC